LYVTVFIASINFKLYFYFDSLPVRRKFELFTVINFCFSLQKIRLLQDDYRMARVDQLRHWLGEEANRRNASVGTITVVPSTFTYGPEYMRKRLRDVFAMVRCFGKPSLFVTYTCNPKWAEIEDNLLPGQTPNDAPLLVATVFNTRLAMLEQKLYNEGFFGTCVAYVRAVEFQKRGLPHAHIVMWLANAEKITEPGHVDAIVTAEIPNPVTHPKSYAAVKEFMLHNKCGDGKPLAKCKSAATGNCSKEFPQPVCDNTILVNQRKRCELRRRAGGHVIDNKGELFNSTWMVATNLPLLVTEDCHVNVLPVTSNGCIKYLFSYLLKGSDALVMQASERGARAGELLSVLTCVLYIF
jgi:hypothetical protein